MKCLEIEDAYIQQAQELLQRYSFAEAMIRADNPKVVIELHKMTERLFKKLEENY